MGGRDFLLPFQIRNGSGYTQDSVIAPGSQAKGIKGLTHQLGTFFIQFAVYTQLFRAHPGIAHTGEITEALILPDSCRIDTLFNSRRGFCFLRVRSSSNFTAGTSRIISILSSSGPEIRLPNLTATRCWMWDSLLF